MVVPQRILVLLYRIIIILCSKLFSMVMSENRGVKQPQQYEPQHK